MKWFNFGCHNNGLSINYPTQCLRTYKYLHEESESQGAFVKRYPNNSKSTTLRPLNRCANRQ